MAERSPVIGVGLTSGTRFEVFPSLLLGETSTIHSTWVEAYLGTGLLGLSLIVALLVQFVVSSWRVRAVTLAPLLFACTIAVRSLTGTTIELAGSTAVLFALLATAAWRRRMHDQCAPDPSHRQLLSVQTSSPSVASNSRVSRPT